MDTQLIALWVVIVVALVLVALGVKYYPKLKNETQGYPLEAQVEAELLPVIYAGICAAFRLQEQGLETLHVRMAGVDKKAIADGVYALLPDKIGEFDLTLVKTLVPPARFEELVQAGFDRFDRFWIEHQTAFYQAFEDWKKAQEG